MSDESATQLTAHNLARASRGMSGPGGGMTEPVSVYDGRTLLGSIKPLPNRRAAATAADGKRLGKFQNQAEAMRAITAHAGTREVAR